MHDECLWKSRTWKYVQYRLLSKIREWNKIFWINKHASSAASEMCKQKHNRLLRVQGKWCFRYCIFLLSFSVWSESIFSFRFVCPSIVCQNSIRQWRRLLNWLENNYFRPKQNTILGSVISVYIYLYFCFCEISAHKEVVYIYLLG